VDVLVAVPGTGVRAYRQTAEGDLVDLASSKAYRPGLLARPESALGVLSSGDADGDGKAELLVAAENFVRALRLEADGTLAIVAQYDARELSAEVTTGWILPAAADGKAGPSVLLHDRKGEQLHLLAPSSDPQVKGLEPLDARGVARIEVVGSRTLTGPGGRRELLLLGRDRFWWMPEGAPSLTLKAEGTRATDLPDLRYNYLSPGDFDADAREELVAIDVNAHVVELLARDATTDEKGPPAWVSRLHFTTFEADPHYQGNQGESMEPRECIVADVTGDGQSDLVLLIHDRVLVYPQVAAEGK
jgi:hypothetical protein